MSVRSHKKRVNTLVRQEKQSICVSLCVLEREERLVSSRLLTMTTNSLLSLIQALVGGACGETMHMPDFLILLLFDA